MTIRITPNFTVRRQKDGKAAVFIGDVGTVLDPTQARDAAEAFNIMAVMLEAAGDVTDSEEAAA